MRLVCRSISTPALAQMEQHLTPESRRVL